MASCVRWVSLTVLRVSCVCPPAACWLQGYANTDQEMGIILQAVLAKNYPKVRKGLYVFPINWWVAAFAHHAHTLAPANALSRV